MATPSKESLKFKAISERPLLGEEIYERLLSHIISQKIEPGSRLMVDELVRDFGVSQTPIRQALFKLHTQGLVVNKRNVGFSVAPLPTPKRFLDMLAIRLLVEPYAAQKAAEHMNPERIEKLRETVVSMKKNMSGTSGSYSEFATRDEIFHTLIAQYSDNEVIVEILQGLQKQMHLFRLRFHRKVLRDTLDEHQKIFDAIAKSDALGAHDAMKEHIEGTTMRVKGIVSDTI